MKGNYKRHHNLYRWITKSTILWYVIEFEKNIKFYFWGGLIIDFTISLLYWIPPSIINNINYNNNTNSRTRNDWSSFMINLKKKVVFVLKWGKKVYQHDARRARHLYQHPMTTMKTVWVEGGFFYTKLTRAHRCLRQECCGSIFSHMKLFRWKNSIFLKIPSPCH